MINYHEFEHGLLFLYRDVIPGFQLFRLEQYPYAVRTGSPDDFLTVEVFEVTNPETERSIHELEIGVGYFYDEVEIRGKRVGIYLFESAGPEPLVKSGDWVQFFGSR